MSKDLEFLRLMVPKNRWATLCNHPMEAEGIVVHNTANTASAKNEILNMINNNNWRSFHVAVDDKRAVQGIEFYRNSWSTSDGTYGVGNRKYISIEICYSKDYSSDLYAKSQDNAAYLIAELLKERNWGIDRVKRHYDFSGKDCPHRMLWWATVNGKYQMVNEDKWLNFLDQIQAYLDELNKGEEVEENNGSYDWKVQVGAYKNKEEAEKYAKELNEKGVETYVYKK